MIIFTSSEAGHGLWYYRTAFVCLLGLIPSYGHAQGGPSPERVIQRMDTDGDGRVSREEWLRPPQAFNRIDSDGDGFATVNELRIFFTNRFSGRSGPASGPGSPRFDRSRPSLATAKSMPVHDRSGYEIVDTHVHLGAGPTQRDFASGVAEALSKMPQRHIALAVILPTPQVRHGSHKRYDHKELRHVARFERLRVAGGSGILGHMLYGSDTVSGEDKKTFRTLARSMVDAGIVAFGEIGLYHYAIPQIGNAFGHVPLNHPLLDILGDVAARSGIPVDVHFDVVPEDTDLPRGLQGADNPDYLEANLSGFEQFLTRNRKTKIVWAHVGLEATPFRTAELCGDLLRRHANLFMSIRLMRGAPKPSAAMDQSGRLKDEWKELFTTFPDRFVFGSESMYGSSMSGMFDQQFALYQKLLAQLPPTVARKIASENAYVIYPLKGKRDTLGNVAQ